MLVHSRQELSMTLLSLHSYVYHKQYFEAENHLNHSTGPCRYYPFCSTLLTEKDENELGEWRALMIKVNEIKKVDPSSQTTKTATMTSENYAQQSYKLTRLSNELKTNVTPLSSSNTITSSQLRQPCSSPTVPHDYSLAKTLADGNKINLKRLVSKESRARKLSTLRSTPMRKPRLGISSKSSPTTSLGLNLSLTKTLTDDSDTKQSSPSILSQSNLAKHDNEAADKSKWIPIPSAKDQ